MLLFIRGKSPRPRHEIKFPPQGVARQTHKMLISKTVLSGLALGASFVGVSGQQNSSRWPLHDNGLTDTVEWWVQSNCEFKAVGLALTPWLYRDHYSFLINGQRHFVFSGEVCPPNPLHSVYSIH